MDGMPRLDGDVVLRLLDAVDGADLAKKIDEAALAEMYVKTALLRRKGALGTRWRTAGAVLWIIQYGVLMLSAISLGAALVYLRFILVPLLMAYFITFILSPIMDCFEQRPLVLFGMTLGKSTCGKFQQSRVRRRAGDGYLGEFLDFLVMLKVPHLISVLLTFVVATTMLGAVGYMVKTSADDFVSQSDVLKARADTIIDSIFESLERTGVKVRRDEGSSLFGGSADQGGAAYSLNVIKDVVTYILGAFWNVVIVLLLSVYLLIDRKGTRTIHGNNVILMEIEEMCQHYLKLKTATSLFTGVASGTLLYVLGVKLAFIWGLLTFMLNFIPNIGSMIATALPIPLVLMDDNLGVLTKLAAFWLPGTVQFYVGNFLEPKIFGNSINCTPISVLAALVLWGSLWGVPGAIVSVQLLAACKICLMHADHPLARYLLKLIQEDATIDEKKERERTGRIAHVVKAFDPILSVQMLGEQMQGRSPPRQGAAAAEEEQSPARQPATPESAVDETEMTAPSSRFSAPQSRYHAEPLGVEDDL